MWPDLLALIPFMWTVGKGDSQHVTNPENPKDLGIHQESIKLSSSDIENVSHLISLLFFSMNGNLEDTGRIHVFHSFLTPDLHCCLWNTITDTLYLGIFMDFLPPPQWNITFWVHFWLLQLTLVTITESHLPLACITKQVWGEESGALRHSSLFPAGFSPSSNGLLETQPPMSLTCHAR